MKLIEAEAEVQRLRVAEAEAMNILEGTELKLEHTEKRAEKAEAERDQALFVADGWHRQFKRAAKARREEKARAKKATEYARIEVKRKNEAVEREAAAIERQAKMLRLAADIIIRFDNEVRYEHGYSDSADTIEDVLADLARRTEEEVADD